MSDEILGRCPTCSRPIYAGEHRPIRTCYCHITADRRGPNGAAVAADTEPTHEQPAPILPHAQRNGWFGWRGSTQ